MIGAKTLAILALVAIGFGTAFGLGALQPERLVTRGFSDLFVVGCFGVVVGTMIYALWALGERSHHYCRWATDAALWEGAEGHFLGSGGRRITIGENRGDAFDFRPGVSYLLCVLASLLLGLACIDARALGLMGKFADDLRTAGSFCPDEQSAPPAPVEDVNAPGCALIRRAYALGYSDSLGDCGPKKKTEAAEPKAICTLRQRDEPFLHYSWRLLSNFWEHARRGADPSLKQARRDFATRYDHLGALVASQRQVLESAPHASHHIFTNLPDPGGAFRPETCGDRYRWLAHRPAPGTGADRASKIFEHVLGQLLFEARYEPAAAACREVHVHFGSPSDICEKLAARPESVLADVGALSSVQAVLERYRLANELRALGGRPPAAEPTSFLSFQCYIEGEAPSQPTPRSAQGPMRKSHALSFAGQVLVAEEVRIAAPAAEAAIYTDRYDALARLLVRGFHYGVLLSEAGLQPPGEGGLEASFVGKDYLLSRLYGLGNIDLYLEPGWIAARPDLLEVYPYQRHLANYVQMFRRQFHGERGRL